MQQDKLKDGKILNQKFTLSTDFQWENWYGLPVKPTGEHTVMFYMKQGYDSSPYNHKDMLRLGFYLYQGAYFKVF